MNNVTGPPLLLMLAFIILAALLVALGFTTFAWGATAAGNGTISANVCLSCSVYSCNDCPTDIEEYKEAAEPNRQELYNFAIAANSTTAKERYCDRLQAIGKFMPDFCFEWGDK